MKQNYVEAKKAYDAICEAKKTYGKYHKTIFHLHTPESYDYNLKGTWDSSEYRQKTESDIIQLCIEENVFPKEFDFEQFELMNEFDIFSSTKEFWSFALLGNALLSNSIEIAVVSDHNSVKGIKKLERVIKHLYKAKQYDKYTHVIAGIEISCADRLHVVGIFDSSEKMQDVEKWLSEKLINPKEGTYETSKHVIEYFSSIGGVAYIAHINTADIYTESGFLSGGYKQSLFGSQDLHIIGLNSSEQIDKVSNFLSKYSSRKYNFVLDNDSHDIDHVSDNVFWIKGSIINYNMVTEALHDFDVSVSLVKEDAERKYIKGIYISHTDEGFLTNNRENTDPFVMCFSEALNCIIGGRGTGKSSILKMLEYIMSQRVESDMTLDFLCKHGNAYVLYEKEGVEYIIEMVLPIKENGDHILRRFGQNEKDRYKYQYTFYEDEVQEYALKRHLSVFKVEKDGKKVSLIKQNNSRALLDDFYDGYYSVNRLVQMASGNEINNYIFNLLFKNKELPHPAEAIKVRSKMGLLKFLESFSEICQKRKSEVFNIIQPFNESQVGKLRIKYSNDEIVGEPNFSEWVFGRSANEHNYFEGYNINENNLIEYIESIYDKVGFEELVRLTLDETHIQKRFEHSIIPFTEEYTMQLADKEIKEITNNNERDIINKIFSELITNSNVRQVIDYLKNTVDKREKFTLEFNVNSKESVCSAPTLYKDILELSLGQKVVAMLDFILGYGEYIHDYRPLIIDQPEDNLDSRYIHKNLVAQLRQNKEKRQIIIATHNATIVTNAMSDLVCVMESDGNHGWIEASGYPSEYKIKKQIVTHLEGGIESFKHKVHIYGDIIL
ncbi:MAG: chromosome segregation protein SMC [Bacillota bacterium]|nr:chromosome segregation protein SMC [Bacillota bacterium]